MSLPASPATALLPVVLGLAFGTLLQKSQRCFVSALRDFVAVKETRVLNGLLAGVVVMTVFWSSLTTLGVVDSLWTPDWGVTSLLGGFVFGVGTTVAGGCAAGTLFRASRGNLEFLLTLVFVFVGHVAFALVYPVLRAHYFAPLRFDEGVSIYQPLPWPPVVTGLLAVTVVLGVYVITHWLRRGMGVQSRTTDVEGKRFTASSRRGTRIGRRRWRSQSRPATSRV